MSILTSGAGAMIAGSFIVIRKPPARLGSSKKLEALRNCPQ